MPRKILVLLIILSGFIWLSGCSSSSTNPVIPVEPSDEINLPQVEIDYENNPRSFLGSFDVKFDLETLTVDIIQNRDTNAHFNITPYVTPVITFNSYNPVTQIIDVDVALTNTSALAAFDVRLIIMTDALGHKLTNFDDWTALYDPPGGLPINPFLAYAKSAPSREFLPFFTHSVNALIYLPGGNPNVTFSFDASINTNCMEPYELNPFQQNTLYDEPGSTCDVFVNVYDWQNNVGTCKLYCPAISGSNLTVLAPTTIPSWSGTLINSNAAPAGSYVGYLIATSPMSLGIDLYDEVIVNVRNANEHKWSRAWGGASDDRGNCIGVDSMGNTFVAGYYSGSVDFDPGAGFDTRNSTASGDIFLAKFDFARNYVGAVTLGGWGFEEVTALDVDINDDVVITGYFTGTMDFDPSAANFMLTSYGNADIFIAKYLNDLSFFKAGSMGGNDVFGDVGWAVKTGPNADIYLTGEFHGTADLDPGPGVINQPAGPNAAVFLHRLDSNFNFMWFQTWCLENDPSIGGIGTGIGIDSSGWVYVIGAFTGSPNLNPGGSDIHTSQSGTFDSFLVRYDSVGNYSWGESWDAFPRGIATDTAGNSYITGNYENTVDFDPSPGIDQMASNGLWDVFLTKFDNSSKHEWVLGWGDIMTDWGTAVCIDQGVGRIQVTGNFELAPDFNPGPIFFPLPSAGGKDIFLSTFDQNANFISVQLAGGPGDDRATAVSHFQGNNCIITGEFSATAEFSFGPPSDPQTSNGLHDIFITTF